MAGFAQADHSGNAFSLGFGGIIEDDEPRLPEEGDAVIDQFGNNADAYLRRGTNFSEALVHQIANMSCIIMVLSGIYRIASSVTNRLGQACNSVITWMALSGGRHATALGRRSARDDSRSVHSTRMLRAFHTACLHAGTQSAYNQCHWSTACYRKLGHQVFV